MGLAGERVSYTCELCHRRQAQTISFGTGVECAVTVFIWDEIWGSARCSVSLRPGALLRALNGALTASCLNQGVQWGKLCT